MHIPTLILGIVVASLALQQRLGEQNALPPEPAFCKALSMAAEKLGIRVYVFSPESYQMISGQLMACCYEESGWVMRPVPLPDIVYDRCFYSHAAQRMSCRDMLEDMKRRKPHVMLGGGLPAKLEVYNALKDDPALGKHLPVTKRYRSEELLDQMLRRFERGVVVKPSAGMQGRGLMHVRLSEPEGFCTVKGRSRHNKPFTFAFNTNRSFMKWINRITSRQAYIVQPYLELSGKDGKPFDVRVLLQKDGTGSWSLTGMAVRCGQEGSITSNLHGGGGALPAQSMLESKFGAQKAEHLQERIHTISKQAAILLESRYGRLAELGLDYGIEPSGRIWLIEVNSKPGRSSFRIISDLKAEQQSIEKPLLYARFLSRRLYPSFAANESANGRHYDLKSDSPLRSFNVQEVHR